MFDYSLFSRRRVSPAHVHELRFDVLVSAFNDSERVTRVFNDIEAERKYWIVHTEYDYTPEELPVNSWSPDPSDSVIQMWERFLLEADLTEDLRVCIDITGMMRPHLLLLPLMLRRLGLSEVTLVYSDPVSYVSGPTTTFTKGTVERVAVLPGFAGLHETSRESRDCLIIGAGYDDTLVRAAAESKRGADHFLLVGMPALQPHMYQESVYRVSRARESINDFSARSLLFAPASNPFMTAQVLSDHVAHLRATKGVRNIYLCPVGPKTQVLGFALFYLCEEQDSATSIIFPHATRYSRETSKGLSSVHVFDIELDMFASASP